MKNKKIVAAIGVLFACLLGIGIYIGGKSLKSDTGEICTDKIVDAEKNSEDENSIDSEIITSTVEGDFDKSVETIDVSDVKKDRSSPVNNGKLRDNDNLPKEKQDNVNEGKIDMPDNSSVSSKQDTGVSDSRDPHTVENNKIPQVVDDIELPIIEID